MAKHKTKIGKNAIETLTLSMYDDHKTIYREYIQNSADAIDSAVKLGLLESQKSGYIEIEIDTDEQRIVIEDNGTGVPMTEAERILKDVAASDKNRSKDKGFRGIGRLAGLAYCKQLIFETSYAGEEYKTTIYWDAVLLQEILYDSSRKEEATAVIELITTVETKSEQRNKHYFKVILCDVNNDELLDRQAVRDYLKMVAPVPYDRTFSYFYKGFISKYMQENNLHLDEYEVYVNNEPISKCYNTSIYDEYGNKKENDEIKELAFFDFRNPSNKKELLAWGWYSISNFEGIIPDHKKNLARGIRLRKHNIQIGSENNLNKFHKDTKRGNFYFFGEIHAVHPELMPNSQRNDFTPTETCKAFYNLLQSTFIDHNKMVYFASGVRSAYRKLENEIKLLEELDTKKFLNNQQKEEHILKVKKAQQDAEAARKDLIKYESAISDNEVNRKIFRNISASKKQVVTSSPPAKEISEKIEEKVRNGNFEFDDLSKLTNAERKLVSKIFSVIADNLPDKKIIPSLVIKVKEAFK
jgi:molecular chaperone HtpG